MLYYALYLLYNKIIITKVDITNLDYPSADYNVCVWWRSKAPDLEFDYQTLNRLRHTNGWKKSTFYVNNICYNRDTAASLNLTINLPFSLQTLKGYPVI